MIAQAIRDKRSVLFVSEKRAALEVVYRRLRDAQLADLCLELHSHKANKRAVVTDLFLALQATRETADSARANLFTERRALRERLDAYVAALHEKRGSGGRTAFEMHGELAELQRTPALVADLPITTYADLTLDAESALRNALEELGRPGVWGAEEQHPWRGFLVDSPVFVALQEITSLSEQLLPMLDTAIDVMLGVSQLLGIEATGGLEQLPALQTLLERVESLPDGVRAEWLTEENANLAAQSHLARDAAERTRVSVRTAKRLTAIGVPQLLDDPTLVEELLPLYQGHYQKRLARFSSAYRRDRRRMRASCGRKIRFDESCDALQVASTNIEASTWLDSRGSQLEELSGGPWPTDIEPTNAIVAAIGAATLMRAYLPSSMSVDTSAALVGDLSTTRGEARRLRDGLRGPSEQAPAVIAALERWLPDGLDGIPVSQIQLETLRARARLWLDHTSLLDQWVNFTRAVQACKELGLAPFLEACKSREVAAEQLGSVLQRLIVTRWVTEVYRIDLALGQFAVESHAAAIEKFRQLDKELFLEARQAVRHAASERQKDVRVAASFAIAGGRAPEQLRPAREEYKKIAKEFQKTKRHIPLRRLLPDLPLTLPVVKPCLLMSPLSVASYLPRDRFQFDLVIFDEASQVLPADAVGAILRAKQVIVLGDSKQLPPTDFFRRRLDDGDDDEPEESEDSYVDSSAYASILEMCLPVMREEWLRWHYRSRDERLINFSNQIFYNERPLITFPNPDPESGDTGVFFEFVENGIYDRGGSRTNVPEASRVADLVIEHFDTYGWSRSLGVITLGVAQRDQILYELRNRQRERPELAPFFAEEGGNEPFFIKNLETVQGDERDDVILSLGYGPSEPGGRPALAFGPVNARGGERRLNVAVTRAKHSMTVVSSMRPEDLDRAALLTSEGPKVLSSYLRYAARGGRFDEVAEANPNAVAESPFEEAVADALRRRAYDVDLQVGVSTFRIDLGVRHPDFPTRYILGVECDGATYHSALSARDRDRLRQEILEEQGWKIYRVWSTDWIQHPERTCDALVSEIERLRSLPGSSSVVRRLDRHLDVATDPEIDALSNAKSTDEQAADAETATTGFSAPFLDEQRQALLFEQSQLERQVDSIRDQQANTKGQPDRGFSGDQLQRVLEQRLERVLAALSEIAHGTYGICQNCGEAIELERLEAVPSTTLCRSCSGA